MIAEWAKKLPDGLFDKFWSRALVRAVFALIEAVVYELRRLLLTAHERHEISLSDAEIAVLGDVAFDVGDGGAIVTRRRFVPIERNIRLMYRGVTDHFGGPPFPSKDPRFAFFSESVRLRNRLTHPKGVENLTVTFEECLRTIAVVAWFGTMLSQLTNAWKEQT